jgi:predicted transcriptional regulator
MKTESITIRISEIEKEQLKNMAQELDVPVSQLIRQAIKVFIQGGE